MSEKKTTNAFAIYDKTPNYCRDCKYANLPVEVFPCNDCSYGHKSRFEWKEENK